MADESSDGSGARYDVIVVGAGNAALCAAIAAREGGASTLVLEKASEGERGGNTYFSGGGFRFPYRGIDDIRTLIPDLSEHDLGHAPHALGYRIVGVLDAGGVALRRRPQRIGALERIGSGLAQEPGDGVLAFGPPVHSTEGIQGLLSDSPVLNVR